MTLHMFAYHDITYELYACLITIYKFESVDILHGCISSCSGFHMRDQLVSTFGSPMNRSNECNYLIALPTTVD